jgi:hypothetical protein
LLCTPILSHFYTKAIILPRHAQDKHRKTLKQEAVSLGAEMTRGIQEGGNAIPPGPPGPGHVCPWQPCPSHPGHSFCPGDSDPHQCDKPPVRPCPPTAAPCPPSGEKTRHFLRCHLCIKTIILPRQARDKHGKNSKNVRFSQATSLRTRSQGRTMYAKTVVPPLL